jgi:hypothetical protein
MERPELLGGHHRPLRRPPSACATWLHGAESIFYANKGGIDVVLKVGDLALPLLCGREFPRSDCRSQVGGRAGGSPGGEGGGQAGSTTAGGEGGGEAGSVTTEGEGVGAGGQAGGEG